MTILLHTIDLAAKSVLISIDGVRYEYFFRATIDCDTARYQLQHWPKKGLNWMKKQALRMEKKEPANVG